MPSEQQIFERVLAAAPAAQFNDQQPPDISNIYRAFYTALEKLLERSDEPGYELTASDAKVLMFFGCTPQSFDGIKAAAQEYSVLADLARTVAGHLEREIAARKPVTLSDLGKSLETYKVPDEPAAVAASNWLDRPGKDPINDDPDALANLGAWVAKALNR
jgi:hypothetical protein